MASSLRVNSIVPSSGTNVAIGTAGGSITYNANVSSVSTFSSGIVVSAGSSIGIGTANPTSPLEVQSSTIPRIISNYNNSKHIGMSVGGSGGGFTLTDTHFLTINHQPYTDRGTDNNLTERFRIDSSGRITTPSQVSFAARVTTQQMNVTGNAVYFTLIADSTSATGSHNVGSHYSTSTGVFTAPVTGRYYFNAHVLYDNSVLTRSGELWLSYNNDSTRWFLDRRYWASGSNITAIGGSVVINVTAGDNIRVRGFVAGGGQDVDVQGSGEPVAHFSGYLLG